MKKWKWIFDYNIVVAIDPDYKKYLHNTDKYYEDFGTDNPWSSEIKSLENRLEELESRQEPEPSEPEPPAAPLADNEILGTDNDALIAALREEDNDSPYRTTDFNEEEMDVLELMTNVKPKTKEMIATDSQAASSLSPLEREKSMIKQQLSRAKKKANNKLLAVETVWELKPEDENQPLPIPRDYIPPARQLAPPKRVLDIGSYVLHHNDIHYRIGHTKYRDASVSLNRVRFSKSFGKIRLTVRKYWYNRVTDVLSEVRTDFNSFVYNPKTRQMYHRTYRKKNYAKTGSHAKPTLRNIGFNYNHFNFMFGENLSAKEVINKFLKEVYTTIKKDVPNLTAELPVLKDSASMPAVELCKAILEHKTNQPAGWVTHHIMEKMISLIGSRDMYDLEHDEVYNPETAVLREKDRRKRVKRIIPGLRKKSNARMFLEAMLFDWYHPRLYDYFLMLDGSHFQIAVKAFKTLPKDAYHYLSHILRQYQEYNLDLSVLVQLSMQVFQAIDGVETTGRSAKKKRLSENFQSYIKFLSKLNYSGHNGRGRGSLTSWDIWRDTFNMARRYNHRIRPNKFKHPNDVKQLHDKLSDIVSRDTKLLREMKDKTFVPFEHPTKEYDGFQFVFLGSPEDLVHEGKTMRHCVGGYSEQCLEGESIIFSMRKDDRGYITLELRGSDLKIVQKYTIKDHTIENKAILKLIEMWHNDIITMHRHDKESHIDKCERIKEAEESKLLQKLGKGVIPDTEPENVEDVKVEIHTLQGQIHDLPGVEVQAQVRAHTGIGGGLGGGIGE